jgi:putative transcriptional regulator
LPVSHARGGIASLLKIAPGAGLPLHTHRGNELTLVLSGGFTDETGAFRRGDLEVADGALEHRPVAMPDQPCICLAVTDAPLNFRGPLGWFFNQWARLSV